MPAVGRQQAIWVSASTGSSNNSGLGPNVALRTIQEGITAASTAGRSTVAILAGTYAEDLTFPPSPIRLVGGVDGMGDRTCNQSSWPTIAATTSVGVDLEGVNVTFEQLTIRAANSSQVSGKRASSYGARIRDADATFTDVTLLAGSGSSATRPMPPPPPPMVACNGTTDCSDGGVGFNGLHGADSMGGTFENNGYSQGDGAPGQPGTNGFNGTRGGSASAECLTGCTSLICTFLNRDCLAETGMVTAEPGSCGCGTRGGIQGVPALGGGASIGLYVSGRSTVTLNRSLVTASAGGNGGEGGPPSMVASPTPGTPGMSQTCLNALGGRCTRADCADSCAPTGTMITFSGANGGPGGIGGAGGRGGSGSGGPSIGLVRVGPNTVVTVDTLTTIAAGQPGSGGQGAANGIRQPQLSVP